MDVAPADLGSATLTHSGQSAARSRIRAVVSSPWSVAFLVFVVYGLYIAAAFRFEHGAASFVLLEKDNVTRSHVSSVIKFDPHWAYAKPGDGYDGATYYLIALDPTNARYYVDHPADRYTKILYPMTARLLALGRANLIPYTLILINWLAVALGTLAIAAWLRRKEISAWFALAYGLYFGLFIAFSRDLVEPMAYALLALAIYLFDYGGKPRLLWSSICFALAILTRDKSAIFALAYAVVLFITPREGMPRVGRQGRYRSLIRNVPRSGMLLVISGLPMLAYLAFLHRWLGSTPQSAIPLGEQAGPLQGFGKAAGLSLASQIPTAYIPAAILVGMSVWALLKRLWRVEIFLLLVAIDLCLVTLNPGYFADAYGVPRVAISIVLAAFLCFPVFDQLTGRNRSWFFLCGASWLFLTVAFLAFLLGGGL